MSEVVSEMSVQQKEGFEVLADLVNRHWRALQMHADTAANVGPGALLPAVTLPQAQLDIQHAIRDAFHAGAAFQAALQPIVEATLTLEDRHIRDAVMAPHTRIDLAQHLPQRDPNRYEKLFAEEALQLYCPTCHHTNPVPRAGGDTAGGGA